MPQGTGYKIETTMRQVQEILERRGLQAHQVLQVHQVLKEHQVQELRQEPPNQPCSEDISSILHRPLLEFACRNSDKQHQRQHLQV